MKPATHDTLKARLLRRLSPGFSYCGRCGMPWNRVQHHETPYSRDDEGRLLPYGSACFPLCEACWARLTIAERIPYYEDLIDDWIRNAVTDAVTDAATGHPIGTDYRWTRASILESVRAGL